MPEKEEIATAIEVLNQAIEIEREGFKFYTRSALTAKDEKSEQMFRTLAAEEQAHRRLILKQYESLSKENKWILQPEVKPGPVDLSTRLFPKDRKTANTDRYDELDVLAFAMEIEMKSYNLYRTASNETASPIGKSTFEFLAGEEKNHFDTLMTRYDYLVGRPVTWQY